MDDRSIPAPRCIVVRLCQSSRLQRQLPAVSEVEPLAKAYQQVFPQVRHSLGNLNSASSESSGAGPSTATRVAKGA
jgi:hypothetical protein